MSGACYSERELFDGVRLVRDLYWYTLFPENVSDPVVETYRDIHEWDLQVWPFCVEGLGVFPVVLGVFSSVYGAFRVPIKMEDVIKHVLMFCGSGFGRAFIFNTFPFITNEVDL